MINSKTIYSKIRYFSILCLFFLFTLLGSVLSGCQEGLEEIIEPPSDTVIAANSVVSNLILRIALSDGSFDNILDNSSCTSLILPVTVTVNGQTIKIDSADDLKTVERILDEFENDDDTLRIIFPVKVTQADYTELIIRNEEELERTIELCKEDGFDEDIECVDFKYPLTFSVYDSKNQLSNVITINDDRELYRFFDTQEEGDLVGFKFPITVILFDGKEITINNNDQLKGVIENASDDCDEDDDSDHNDDDADDAALINALLASDWEITYFFNGTDKTKAFDDFVLKFFSDRTASATDGVSLVKGTWQSYGDEGFLELEFDFEEAPFNDLQKDWELVEFTDSSIKLKNVSEKDGSVSTLFFKKK